MMKVIASLAGFPALLITLFLLTLLPTAVKAQDRCLYVDCSVDELLYELERERQQYEVDRRLDQIEQRQREQEWEDDWRRMKLDTR